MNIKNEITTAHSNIYNNESKSTSSPSIKHTCKNNTKYCEKCLITYNNTMWVEYFYNNRWIIIPNNE